jgi:hypothetical protein
LPRYDDTFVQSYDAKIVREHVKGQPHSTLNDLKWQCGLRFGTDKKIPASIPRKHKGHDLSDVGPFGTVGHSDIGVDYFDKSSSYM